MKRKIGRNDPCPCGSGKKYKRCCGAASLTAGSSLPDPRLIERELRGLGQALEGKEFASTDEMKAFIQENRDALRWTPKTILDQAQEHIYRAWESPKRGDRIRLARQALELSQDCADAYVVLAEEVTETMEQARDLYRRGVEAGERALGPGAFQEHAGHFWGVVETRPYMRAREGLAHCLWELGERQAAVEHYQDMLRLNPSDNQGIRYVLLACLMELGRLDQAEKLLAEYEGEETAAWLFTTALLLFRRHGDSPKARTALKEALAANRHVASYVLGQRRMPKDYPSYVEVGSQSEAVEYVALYQPAWTKTPGALDWLAGQVRGRPLSVAQPRDEVPERQLTLELAATSSEPVAAMERPAEEITPTRQEWRRLYQTAASFKELAPWQWMDDSDLFAVQNPETGEVGYCSIMGGLGEVFALAVFLGPEGLEGYRRLIEGELKPSDFKSITLMRCLLASFEGRESLDKRDLAVIRELGLRFRGRRAWPQFRSYLPGYAPWYVTGPEARFLAAALEQAVEVAARVRKGLDLFEGVDEDLVLVREWYRAGKTWRDAWRPLPLPAPPQPVTAFDETQLRQLRERFGVPRGTWQVDLFPIPALVEERGQRPYYPKVWLCVDQETGFIIGTATVESWRSPKECQEAFISVLEKAPSLAATLQVSREVKELVAPLARSLGIVVQERRRLAALEKAKRSMISFLRH